MKISLIVPTKDRPVDLERLLESLARQTRPADEILIIDGSDEPIKHVTDRFTQLPITYIPVRPPSLPAQRNAGIEALSEDTDWTGFLDDDLVLMDRAVEEMETFIDQQDATKLRGVGLKIKDQPTAKAGFFNRLFLLAGKEGEVTLSGFASEIPPVEKDIDVDWVYGGATFWHKSVFDEFLFDEWFKGTGYLEDVDFSYRVSRKYELKVCASAECLHLSHPIRREKQKSIGEWQIVAWWYFVSKHSHFSRPLVFWAMSGILLRNVLKCALGLSADGYLRARGNIGGLLKIFNGTAKELRGFSK